MYLWAALVSAVIKERFVSISIEIAHRVMDACKRRAQELRSPVSIAIVDAGGHLVMFERMMAPYGWATGNISIAKATTAVMFNQSTDAVAQWGSGIPGFASSLASMTQGRFIMAAGGWPLRLGGATVGGIGVSGGNAPGRDDDIARAGLAALEAFAPPVPVANNYAAQRTGQSVQPIPSYPSMPVPQAQQPSQPQQPLQPPQQPQPQGASVSSPQQAGNSVYLGLDAEPSSSDEQPGEYGDYQESRGGQQ